MLAVMFSLGRIPDLSIRYKRIAMLEFRSFPETFDGLTSVSVYRERVEFGWSLAALNVLFQISITSDTLS